MFAETFTNPLVRAQDLDALRDVIDRGARARRPALRLVLDSTIATPWAFKHAAARPRRRHRRRPAAPRRSAATIATCGATSPPTTRQFANAVMDLMAMRGGILDWRRADGDRWRRSTAPSERTRAARRPRRGSRRSWRRIPKVSEVFHPSLPDASRRARRSRSHYVRHGSLLSFRVAGADEDRTRHFADVLATTVDRPLRAVVRRPGDQGQSPPDRVRVLHRARSAEAQRLRSADSPGGRPRGRRRSDRRAQLDAASRRPRHRRRHRTTGSASAPPRWGSDDGRRRTSRHQAGRIRQD